MDSQCVISCLQKAGYIIANVAHLICYLIFIYIKKLYYAFLPRMRPSRLRPIFGRFGINQWSLPGADSEEFGIEFVNGAGEETCNLILDSRNFKCSSTFWRLSNCVLSFCHQIPVVVDAVGTREATTHAHNSNGVFHLIKHADLRMW